MIAYFPDDEIIDIPFGSNVKGLVNENGDKPYAIILDEAELLSILNESDSENRKINMIYITEALPNAVENPKEINLTIA